MKKDRTRWRRKLQLQHVDRNILPDLVVNICPFGCNTKCNKLWINKQTSHQIICLCTCHERKDQALETVRGPASNALEKCSQVGGLSLDD